MEDDLIGTEVDGYRVEEVLGRGGMGVVYRAEDVTLSRTVALKCINRSLSNDESFLRRFRSEARALAQIESPYIVQVYTLSRLEMGLVIVMEFVEGTNLKQQIGEDGLAWRKALPLLRQMLTGLEHAHAADVIHRDVKPHNILLADASTLHGNRVKMTDFGLAKVNTTGDRSRTVTEGVYGSLNYMSPEQVESLGGVDHRSDLYSLGMTAYEMLAGRLPFEEEGTTYRIMRTIVEEDLPPLDHFADEVPQPLVDVVMKTLEKDPADRFQSAAEMKTAVDEVRAQCGADGNTPVAADDTATPVSDPSPPTREGTASGGEPDPPSDSAASRPSGPSRKAGAGRLVPALRRVGVVGGLLLLLVGGLAGVGWVVWSGDPTVASPGTAPQEQTNAPSAKRPTPAASELPTALAPLVDVKKGTVLEAKINRKVQEGALIKGAGPDDFFIPPEQCFVFVVDPASDRVTAVIDTGTVRVDLRSGTPVSNWPTAYADHRQIWVATTK
jgi:serine/threonine protein kinase